MIVSLLLLCSQLSAQDSYVRSYIMDVDPDDQSNYKPVMDKCELVDRPIVGRKKLMVEYHGGYYYFKFNLMRNQTYRSQRYKLNQPTEETTGVVSFQGAPYSFREENYGEYYTLTIIPLLWNIRSNINHLRAFEFTNDPEIIKKICQ